ncbi:MAG: hypothetical protein EOP92_36790 [Lysobacteraceae bacterium]|nr:MAG: hypothetical protein EOP92_36790 [Xanthomonadaceae bacterium]
MRITFTPGQVAMLIGRAERQLEQIVADSIREAGNGRNISRGAQYTLHETVVTLIRLYREQVPQGAPVATRIARAYAKGTDAHSGVPTLACVRTILSVMRDAQQLLDVLQPVPEPAPAPEPQQHLQQRPANMTAG